jgi:hypothetical protein
MRWPRGARAGAQSIAGIAALATLAIGLGAHAVAAPHAVGGAIFKGHPTTAYPAVVWIEIQNMDQTVGLCSGTLIAPTVVLTAGHCLAFDPVVVRVAIFADGVDATILDAARWEVHPEFDIDRLAVADVAALVLATPAVGVAPIPLVATRPRPRSIGTIIGFGDDAVGGTGVKRAARVHLSRCPRVVRRIGIAPGQLDGSLCWRPRRHTQDTCHGDSGGPLLIDGVLAGVTSGGFPECPGTLSWDTSVVAVRAWIDDFVARAAATP